MNSKTPLLSFFALFAMALGISISSSCRSPIGTNEPATTEIVTSPAHPALTYYGKVKRGDSTYQAIFVMDSDGTHQTPLYIAPQVAMCFSTPNWSPDGRTILFTQSGANSWPDTIKAIDLSTRANAASPGVSSVRILLACDLPGTVTGVVSPTGQTLGNTNFSSTAAKNEIVYSKTIGDQLYLCAMPASTGASGGASTVIYSGPAFEFYPYCSWSPDDSRMACCLPSMPYGQSTIYIYNTSDWTLTDSIHFSGVVDGIEWSRDGENKIAFARASYWGQTFYLYYCDAKTGAKPTTNGEVGVEPTWSPDNSCLVCFTDKGLVKVPAFGRTATLIAANALSGAHWKR